MDHESLKLRNHRTERSRGNIDQITFHHVTNGHGHDRRTMQVRNRSHLTTVMRNNLITWSKDH